jgi:DNA-binding response OmpR family regulator
VKRLLLVDDTPQVAELLTFSLHDHGYQVSATGYDTAINELIEHERIDAVVLSCSLFDMSESLFDMVRDDDRHRALPVVIISDAVEQAVASLTRREARHVRLVPKPFTGSQVAHALDQLLDAG